MDFKLHMDFNKVTCGVQDYLSSCRDWTGHYAHRSISFRLLLWPYCKASVLSLVLPFSASMRDKKLHK